VRQRTRRRRLFALPFLLGLASIGCSESPKPNVLVIIADDLGFADVGYRGSEIRTPTLDALAASGLRLERFYAHPFCSPTRAAFYSGAPPRASAFGVAGINVVDGTGIEPEIGPVAERFRDAGYDTALIGKWHLGTRPEMHPNEHGFDTFYGFLGGAIRYFTHDWLIHASGVRHPDWQRNGVEVDEPGYATTLLGQDAARFVSDRGKGRPFFLVLSFNAPHFPAQAEAEIVEWYREHTDCAERRFRCVYMAQVDTMDREIGRVLGALERTGKAGETLVLFFSDNGGDTNWGASNAPFAGGKGQASEGALRVPGILAWQGVLEPGSTQQRMRAEDLFATLEAAAGLERRAPAPGMNLWQALVEGRGVEREPFYFTTSPETVTALSRDCATCFRSEERHSALLTDAWKLVTTQRLNETGDRYAPERAERLYDLVEDPFEERDVSNEEADVLLRMRERLLAEEDTRT
jgi:arylsulfatase A-like enzyme